MVIVCLLCIILYDFRKKNLSNTLYKFAIMAYRNIYISQEEYFAAYYGTDKYYEGFVIGYGYVYMKSFFSTPPHWNGYNSTPIKPDVEDTFCQMGYERLVDTSNEAVKLSWQGLFENDIAEFCVKEGMT